MNNLIISSLLTLTTGFIAGAALAIKYGVSITGVVKQDINALHAKIEIVEENVSRRINLLRHHVSVESDSVKNHVQDVVENVVADANAEVAKVEAKVEAVKEDLAK